MATTVRSRWIETEIAKDGRVYLLPIRCRLEARSSRIRTVIQTMQNGSWETDHKTNWVASPYSHRLRESQLDSAAQELADNLVKDLETGDMHAEWIVPSAEGQPARL